MQAWPKDTRFTNLNDRVVLQRKLTSSIEMFINAEIISIQMLPIAPTFQLLGILKNKILFFGQKSKLHPRWAKSSSFTVIRHSRAN
jgi:hypothetical protein